MRLFTQNMRSKFVKGFGMFGLQKLLRATIFRPKFLGWLAVGIYGYYYFTGNNLIKNFYQRIQSSGAEPVQRASIDAQDSLKEEKLTQNAFQLKEHKNQIKEAARDIKKQDARFIEEVQEKGSSTYDNSSKVVDNLRKRTFHKMSEKNSQEKKNPNEQQESSNGARIQQLQSATFKKVNQMKKGAEEIIQKSKDIVRDKAKDVESKISNITQSSLAVLKKSEITKDISHKIQEGKQYLKDKKEEATDKIADIAHKAEDMAAKVDSQIIGTGKQQIKHQLQKGKQTIRQKKDELKERSHQIVRDGEKKLIEIKKDGVDKINKAVKLANDAQQNIKSSIEEKVDSAKEPLKSASKTLQNLSQKAKCKVKEVEHKISQLSDEKVSQQQGHSVKEKTISKDSHLKRKATADNKENNAPAEPKQNQKPSLNSSSKKTTMQATSVREKKTSQLIDVSSKPSQNQHS